MTADTPNLATLVGEFAVAKAEYKTARDKLNHLEAQIIAAIREEYPIEYKRWQQGIAAVKAEGITIPVTRSWDPDKVRAEFGEERPDLIVEEIIPEQRKFKVDGTKAASMMRDAALARRLTPCLNQPVPKVRLG